MNRLLILLLLFGIPTPATSEDVVEIVNPRGQSIGTQLTDNRRKLTAGFTGFDQLIAAPPTQVFEEGFATGLDTEKVWTVTTVGAGTITVQNAQGDVNTFGTNDSSKMVTQLPHQFLHGFSNTWRIRVRLDDTVSITGGVREWGIFDTSDGYLFRMDENGLHVVIRRLTVETVIDEVDFANIIPNGGLVPTAMSYAIQYLNGNRVLFYINNDIVHEAASKTGSLVATSQLRTTINNFQTALSTGGPQMIQIYGLAMLRDGSPNTYDTIGRLRVTGGVSEAPPGTIEVMIPATPKISITANQVVDEFFTITDGKTLTLQALEAGVESAGTGKSVMIELFDDPNGDLSVLIPIPAGFLIGNNFNDERILSASFLGDGIRRILLRTTQLGAANITMSREWRGFEQ